jgi:hypothetical protein
MDKWTLTFVVVLHAVCLARLSGFVQEEAAETAAAATAATTTAHDQKRLRPQLQQLYTTTLTFVRAKWNLPQKKTSRQRSYMKVGRTYYHKPSFSTENTQSQNNSQKHQQHPFVQTTWVIIKVIIHQWYDTAGMMQRQ